MKNIKAEVNMNYQHAGPVMWEIPVSGVYRSPPPPTSVQTVNECEGESCSAKPNVLQNMWKLVSFDYVFIFKLSADRSSLRISSAKTISLDSLGVSYNQNLMSCSGSQHDEYDISRVPV